MTANNYLGALIEDHFHHLRTSLRAYRADDGSITVAQKSGKPSTSALLLQRVRVHAARVDGGDALRGVPDDL